MLNNITALYTLRYLLSVGAGDLDGHATPWDDGEWFRLLDQHHIHEWNGDTIRVPQGMTHTLKTQVAE